MESHSLCGQPAPVSDHLHGEKRFPLRLTAISNASPCVCCLLSCHCSPRQIWPHLLCALHRTAEGHGTMPRLPSRLKTEQNLVVSMKSLYSSWLLQSCSLVPSCSCSGMWLVLSVRNILLGFFFFFCFGSEWRLNRSIVWALGSEGRKHYGIK